MPFTRSAPSGLDDLPQLGARLEYDGGRRGKVHGHSGRRIGHASRAPVPDGEGTQASKDHTLLLEQARHHNTADRVERGPGVGGRQARSPRDGVDLVSLGHGDDHTDPGATAAHAAPNAANATSSAGPSTPSASAGSPSRPAGAPSSR